MEPCPYHSIVLRMVGEHPMGANASMYSRVVPMLCCYHPEIKTQIITAFR